MCLMCQTTEKDPRQESSLSTWTGGATEKDWPKRPSDHQLQEVQKRLWWGHNSCGRGHPCPHKRSSCTTFTLNFHWGRAATGKKVLCLCVQGRFGSVDSLWPCRLWPARLLCQGGGFSRQKYWSVLAITCCHTLLEHCISCCPSCQLPWVPGAARTPVTQAGAPPPHLALTGADPSPPGQLQKQSPVDNPHAEVEIKPNWNPGSVWLRRKTQNLPTCCTSCRLNPHNQLGRLCVYGIYTYIIWTLRPPTKENVLVLIAVDIRGKNTQEQDQIRVWAFPTAGPETSAVLEGILGR